MSKKDKELNEMFENISNDVDGTLQLDSTTTKNLLSLMDNITEKWIEIKSDKGKFSIKFPDLEIKEGHTNQLINGKKFTIYHYSVNTQNTNNDNLGYRIDYSFWPEIKTKSQINNLLNDQRDYILSAANASLEYENIIDSLDYSGRELHLTIDNSKIKSRYRMFFHEGIFYKLMVVTEDGKLFNKSLSNFLNSFKIY